METSSGTDISNWTYQDFLAYLLIYAASADLEMKPEEKKAIIDEVGRLEFEKIIHVFEKHSDFECLQVIMDLSRKYCKDQQQRDILLADMKKVFFADEQYSVLEENCLRTIRKLLC